MTPRSSGYVLAVAGLPHCSLQADGPAGIAALDIVARPMALAPVDQQQTDCVVSVAESTAVTVSTPNAVLQYPALPLSRVPAGPQRMDHLVRRILAILVRTLESEGALLLHAALVEREGTGLLLAARGGGGKSTAASRLPLPWRAHCDDATLIVPQGEHSWAAHPWPTWSMALGSESNVVWPLSTEVQARAVVFLEHSRDTCLRKLGKGETAARVSEAADQLAGLWRPAGQQALETRDRLARFRAACRASDDLAGWTLGLSKNGPFWSELTAVWRHAETGMPAGGPPGIP